MEPRIGDVEREIATTHLSDHFAAGRLDHEEYDERLDAIWSARTKSDLDQLFWDLPRIAERVIPVAPASPAIRSRPGRSSHNRRVVPPFVPMLVIAILVTVAVLATAPWVLLIAAGWLVFFRPRKHPRSGCPGHQTSRSRSCA